MAEEIKYNMPIIVPKQHLLQKEQTGKSDVDKELDKIDKKETDMPKPQEEKSEVDTELDKITAAAKAAESTEGKPPTGEPSEEFLEKLRWLATYFEKIKIGDYVQMIQQPKRLIKVNFLVGIARGIGIGIGFTLLGAFTLYLLNRLAILNLPLIGDFISELMGYVEKARGIRI